MVGPEKKLRWHDVGAAAGLLGYLEELLEEGMSSFLNHYQSIMTAF